jgi:hypothetical protein
MSINLEKEIKIRFSNLDNNLLYNESLNMKRICVIGLSKNFDIIWYYIKKILDQDKIINLKRIKHLDISNNIENKILINNKRIELISRKIRKEHFQVPIYKNSLPDKIYSSSF